MFHKTVKNANATNQRNPSFGNTPTIVTEPPDATMFACHRALSKTSHKIFYKIWRNLHIVSGLQHLM